MARHGRRQGGQRGGVQRGEARRPNLEWAGSHFLRHLPEATDGHSAASRPRLVASQGWDEQTALAVQVSTDCRHSRVPAAATAARPRATVRHFDYHTARTLAPNRRRAKCAARRRTAGSRAIEPHSTISPPPQQAACFRHARLRTSRARRADGAGPRGAWPRCRSWAARGEIHAREGSSADRPTAANETTRTMSLEPARTAPAPGDPSRRLTAHRGRGAAAFPSVGEQRHRIGRSLHRAPASPD
jgi:hypothetical protein